jgi:hypothetical protein
VDYEIKDIQWTMTVEVVQNSKIGHGLTLIRMGKNRPVKETFLGSWRGLGVPEAVLVHARTAIDAAFTDYLMNRYGVAEELPLKWSGELEPF